MNVYAYVGGNPGNYFDPYGLYSWLKFGDDVSNFLAGFGDAMTFDITKKIRDQWNEKIWGFNPVDECGNAYGAGGWPGAAISPGGKIGKGWVILAAAKKTKKPPKLNKFKNPNKASESLARAMADQIERDLGIPARTDFHDLKEMGIDRSKEQLMQDAADLYEQAGKRAPSWMR